MNDGSEYSGKTVLVAGAAGGIGSALCTAFAGAGAHLIMLDRAGDDQPDGQLSAGSLASELQAAGHRADFTACDLTRPESIEAALRISLGEGPSGSSGTLDVLIYNAAAFTPTVHFAELDEEQWDTAVRVNLTGAFLLDKYALPWLRRSRHGVILHIASQLGHSAVKGQTAYCATKAGLIHMTRAMAADLADEGIRVVSISPGGTATSRLEHRFGSLQEAEKVLGSKHLLNRLARPEEIAEAALFLAGSRASFITGSDLLVDGGYTAV